VIAANRGFRVAVAVGPGAEFLRDPGGEAGGGVGKAVSQGLRLGALDPLVAGQYRAKDFVLVDAHAGGEFVEQAAAEEEPVLVSLQLQPAAIDDQVGILGVSGLATFSG
jgi:hypothetical protein